MCGINAIIDSNGTQSETLRLLKKMYRATKHRGEREIVQSINGALVSFNWLQITDKRINHFPNQHKGTIVYLNGYISNFRELAAKYEIELFTNCDIEFLAKFIDMFGDKRNHELNGFFAVLYYSKQYKAWYAFTDRYGIKQLYHYTDPTGAVFFSSEVKGILAACPEIKVDEEGLNDWRSTLGVMNPVTIYKGINRACKLGFDIPPKIDISYEDAKERLRELLHKAIERNRFDGKTGVYLSGGVDSGILAKWIKPEYCFSVDYVDAEFSEIELIKKNSINAHLSIVVNPETAAKYSDETMKALDDLKAGSCYTNFAIAELASNFVQVVYSGAGGDEFFGGYPHRKNKPINEVIQRTEQKPGREYDISHFEYDLKFLDAVLVVEDRMAGFHTMETRYPLLDNDLVDFALCLPDEYLENKRILKDISGLHLDVIAGRKRGFSNPYFTNEEWINFTIENLTNG